MRIILWNDLPCGNICCEEIDSIDLSFVSEAEENRECIFFFKIETTMVSTVYEKIIIS